ncbi:MAG TPA: MBL fold metallo-hydrolase [Syntrophorhabdaceae bacterium]|nr:MBL fold metallo-hydrolase [Syntrophorhabdaceae bacterium]
MRIAPASVVRYGVLALLFLSLASCLPPKTFNESEWRNRVAGTKKEMLYAPHFKDGRYFNPWMPMERNSFWAFLRWKFEQKADYTAEERAYVPALVPDLKKRIQSLPGGDFIVWIGHGTFLIRINGEYWITDPMFSERALLPKRKVPPGITAEEIKGLGGKVNVIISHNHYDHLDEDSIAALPGDARVFVPLGLKKFVQGMGKRNVEEMDWWQTIDCGNNIKIICLPAQHWSRRAGQGFNETLWASYLLVTPDVSIYYGADSGYFIGYKEFGKRFPGIDYALLPTTAFTPRWFMHYAHVDIPEVLDSFQELNAKYFMPTQWGTFHLGDEPVGYPVLTLRRMIKERNLDPSRFIITDIGQIVPIAKKR